MLRKISRFKIHWVIHSNLIKKALNSSQANATDNYCYSKFKISLYEIIMNIIKSLERVYYIVISLF